MGPMRAGNEGLTMAVNRKRLLLPRTMARAGWEIANGRDDVEAMAYAPGMATAEFRALLHDIDGIALALTPFSVPELAVAPRMRVVARIGVGFDTVDVPALNAR